MKSYGLVCIWMLRGVRARRIEMLQATTGRDQSVVFFVAPGPWGKAFTPSVLLATLDLAWKEKVRWHALQEKSNGSITPRGMALSARTAERTCSSTTLQLMATVTKLCTREIPWSSR